MPWCAGGYPVTRSITSVAAASRGSVTKMRAIGPRAANLRWDVKSSLITAGMSLSQS